MDGNGQQTNFIVKLLNMNKFTIISYYTSKYKSIYEAYLKPSITKLSLNCIIEASQDFGSWKKNTDYKPIFIKQCLKMCSDNLVFIDVDAVVNQYPVLFESISNAYDIGLHFLDWAEHYGRNNQVKELLSGTLYIQNNEHMFNLVNTWIKELSHDILEQQALERALKMHPEINVFHLPREYCYITSLPNGELPAKTLKNPIISHYQASRQKT